MGFLCSPILNCVCLVQIPFYTATCNCVVTSVRVFTFWCTKLQLQETLHKCCMSRTKLTFPLTLTPEERKANLRELEQLTVSVLFCLFVCCDMSGMSHFATRYSPSLGGFPVVTTKNLHKGLWQSMTYCIYIYMCAIVHCNCRCLGSYF